MTTDPELLAKVEKIVAQARLDVVGGTISGWHCNRARESHARRELLEKLHANTNWRSRAALGLK
jgi:hypothetical protein